MSANPRFRPARVRWGLIPPTDEAPDDKVRDHLRGPLLNWCVEQGLVVEERRKGDLSALLRDREGTPGDLTDRGVRMCLHLRLVADNQEGLEAAVLVDQDQLIDMADWLVQDSLSDLTLKQRRRIGDPKGTLRSDSPDYLFRIRHELRRLDRILGAGGSAWAVDFEGCCLTRRIGTESRETYAAAVAPDDQVSVYLRDGWQAAWGVSPSSDLAHENAVNALEALFRPVVTPKEPDATLSKIVSCLEAKPSKWRARLEDRRSPDGGRRTDDAGVLFVANALRTVFQSDHRHAAAEGSPPHTEEDGRDAITIAAAVIALQRRGFLDRIDAPE